MDAKGKSMGESLDSAVHKAQDANESAVKGVSKGVDVANSKVEEAKTTTGENLDKAGHKAKDIKESAVKGASETADVAKG
mmetsp:Transcript_21359/g.49837  ORF Transcript_21359/g.49837 Transcript_21359/m.49837 type:complete len:80 (+) Transcript_21359:176-415(+)